MKNPPLVIPIECHFGPISAFIYYIDGPEPAIIDAGVHATAVESVETALKEHGIDIESIRWILLTHGHVDHLGGAYALLEKTGFKAKVVIPKHDAYLLKDRQAHIADYLNLQGKYVDVSLHEKHIEHTLHDIGDNITPTLEVVDGDIISLGDNITLQVIETPGHSNGSVTFVLQEENWAFAADAVQIFGGTLSGIPTIENSEQYKASVERLLNDIKPNKLFLGHRFRDRQDQPIFPVLEGREAVDEVLNASLEKDAWLRHVIKRHLSRESVSIDESSLYGEFKEVAEDMDYAADPRNMPCSFFVTVHSYKNELQDKKSLHEI